MKLEELELTSVEELDALVKEHSAEWVYNEFKNLDNDQVQSILALYNKDKDPTNLPYIIYKNFIQ